MMVAPERITADPAVMYGKPVVQGTRITVEQIRRLLAAGQAPEAIVKEHPRLTVEDIRAVNVDARSGRIR